MRSLSPDVVENVLQWLDLAAHLRLREASLFDRDETPRRTRTLAARDCEQARRCQEKIFTPDKNTRLHSITLDIVAPNGSRSSGGGGSSSSSSTHHHRRNSSDGNVMPPLLTSHLSSYNVSLSSFLDDASGAARRAALTLLVREHRPAELRFKNMIRGGEFSDALLSLEQNLDQVRRDLCVLHLGLATGGPRPYQDPRSHHWCMLRLRRVLGPAAAPNGGGSSSAREGVAEEGEDGVNNELTDLTKEILGSATAAATMPHLIGKNGGLPEEDDEIADNGINRAAGDHQASRSQAASVTQGHPTGGLKAAYWPRLSELRLSCGIVVGDLERLSGCLGSFPNLQILDLRGHAFRPPPTSFSEFAHGLQAYASSSVSPTDPAFRPGRLTTLSLMNFKVEGVDGVAALGKALSAERFPHLAALSINSCRLADQQLSALAETLPGMSRTLKSLSFRSNYALSAEGIKTLAKALRTGWGSGSRSHSRCCRCCCSTTVASATETCLSPTPLRGCCGLVDGSFGPSGAMTATAATTKSTAPLVGETVLSSTALASAACTSKGGSARAPAASIFSTTTVTEKSLPETAPAWSVPSPSAPPRPRPVSSHSLACSCQERRAPATAAAADLDDRGDDDVALANAPPLKLESLDLSYSCWWSRPNRTTRTGRESSDGPFANLLEVLREGGACASLRSLRLEGCYLGDSAVRQLVAALESESGSCRSLRVLEINGNLFGEVGVRLFADAFLSGKMPPHLQMVVFCANVKPSYRQLHAGVSLKEMNETIGLWIEHQRGVHASVS